MLRFKHAILQRILLLLPIIFVSFKGVRTEAPLYKAANRDKIPGQYIVVLKDDMDMDNYAKAFDDMIHWDTPEGTMQREYRHTIKGFASRLSPDSVKKLRQSKMVKYIEEDAMAYTSSVASWGLDRVDQRDLPLDNITTYLGDGADTHIYVVDTGIRYSHVEFINRTGDGFNVVDDGYSYDTDCDGHGTHCAGTAAGSTYGVASNATVHGVRVFGCTGSGSYQAVIAGLEWIFENATRPAVCSMSLGGSVSQAVNDVVRMMVDAGIVVSVAGGNENAYACDVSPASAPEAITVGSTTIDDERSYFSNYGRCLDIFAPGSQILSAGYTADNASRTISGTSMSCPQVSGAAAILLGINNTLTPYDVTDMLLRSATLYKVKDAQPLSPNRLLYIGVDTCMTRCNSSMDVNRACQCDAECSDRDDCCEDYPNLCWNNEPTCIDRCGDYNNVSYPCQCDEDCWSRMDCCHDYVTLCRPTHLPCDRTMSYPGPLYSTHYPDNYLNDQTCRILLINEYYGPLPDNNTIVELHLIVRDFNLEDSSNCTNDSLTILDGDDDNSTLIGKFCGTRYPLFAISSGPSMTLILTPIPPLLAQDSILTFNYDKAQNAQTRVRSSLPEIYLQATILQTIATLKHVLQR
ncbi:extracellular serine proteinase-like [Amphiura filiformis]|uniref:extracellular serine proteinase-like n=1 Tax=Amphiura filiformis TaxID=82378 RepID=UPI003B22285A